MSDVLVSVCCTTYNHEKFIGKTLDGFLMQETEFEYEILINEDCSTDKTAEILRDYEKRFPNRLDIIYQKENIYSKRGKPLTKVLFSKVRGKYVALCEGDDYWTDTQKLQKQVDFLEQNSQYSMCFHKSIIVDADGRILADDPTFIHLAEKDFNGVEMLEKWSVPTASVMFRSEFIEPVREKIINSKYYYGDTPMFLTLLEYGKARCLPDSMSAYRIHAGGVSRKNTEKSMLSLYNHYQLLRKDFDGKYRGIMKTLLAGYAFWVSVFYIKKLKLAKGIKYLAISISYDIDPLKNFIVRKLKLLQNENNSLEKYH